MSKSEIYYYDAYSAEPIKMKVKRIQDSLQTIRNVNTDSMANTSSGKEKDKKSKRKLKDKEKKEAVALLGGAGSKPPKPLKHKRANSMDMNHRDDGYLKHKDPRLYRRQSTTVEIQTPCFKCLRSALHCYNIVVLIMGCGALAVGVWLLVTDFSAREISVIVHTNLFEIGTYLILGGGGLIALLAFCGCCGTMREDKCILGFYGVVLLLVLCALCVGGVLAFTFKATLRADMSTKMIKSIQQQYGNDVRSNSTNRLITDAWDSMQRKLGCCGVTGNISHSKHSWEIYRDGSHWYRSRTEQVPFVPESCCTPNADLEMCQGKKFMGPPSMPHEPGHPVNPHLYTDGCYDKVLLHIQQHSLILGAVALAVPLFLIVGVIITFCMCCKVKKAEGEGDEEIF
ncbi:tetraspanin-18B-like isoform X2 [Mytilus trossulus]|uniref:tetraspanin-18B-like isoform X2 n=1 Tax=Mytilus trossulus TaxID=6551 RepID=UPI003006F1E5